MTPKPDPKTICFHCMRPEREHWAVNYSDGQMVAQSTLICPQSVFKSVLDAFTPDKQK